jgi:hypothetical protein
MKGWEGGEYNKEGGAKCLKGKGYTELRREHQSYAEVREGREGDGTEKNY